MGVTYLRSIQLLLLLGLCACGSEQPPAPGIYYWQSEWNLTEADGKLARQTGLTDLYLRMLDIGYDPVAEAIVPRGPVQLPNDWNGVNGLRITPVVYIVNDVFRYAVDAELLADRLLTAVQRLAGGHPAILQSGRLQIDCDWTPTTREAYFGFLQTLRRKQPQTELSVTVRLHQYRERRQNGIPPVDRGLLMCYNMAPVQRRATHDAIFDLSLLKGYLKEADSYPLPLDAALPLFSWGAAFRDDRFLGLVDFPTPGGALLPFPDDRYLVARDTTVGRLLLRAGDEIRGDGPGTYENLRTAVKLLRDRSDIEELLFYDWRPGRLTDYRVADLINEYYD